MVRPKSENPRSTQLSMRVQPEMLERIDAVLQTMRVQAPGPAYTRTDAVMALLEQALQIREAGAKKRR
jgi:hypothetical protein